MEKKSQEKKRKLKTLKKRGEESKATAGPKWIHGMSPKNKPSSLTKKHHVKKALKEAGIKPPKKINEESLKNVLEKADKDKIDEYNEKLQERYIADTLEVNEDITKQELEEKLDVSEKTLNKSIERYIADTLRANEDITKQKLKQKLEIPEKTLNRALKRARETSKEEIHQAKFKVPPNLEKVKERLEKGGFKKEKE